VMHHLNMHLLSSWIFYGWWYMIGFLAHWNHVVISSARVYNLT